MLKKYLKIDRFDSGGCQLLKKIASNFSSAIMCYVLLADNCSVRRTAGCVRLCRPCIEWQVKFTTPKWIHNIRLVIKTDVYKRQLLQGPRVRSHVAGYKHGLWVTQSTDTTHFWRELLFIIIYFWTVIKFGRFI